jgi:Tol biopolymer transport system component
VDEKGSTNLWVRALNAQRATMLPGTEDAATPFWSPDGHYLGFVADRKLKKISVSGGEPQILTDDAQSYCGDWGEDGTILFCKQYFGPIYRVSASGGEASPLTKVDRTNLATSDHRSFRTATTSFMQRAGLVPMKSSLARSTILDKMALLLRPVIWRDLLPGTCY